MNTQDSEKSQKVVSARRRLFQIMAVGGTAAVVLPEKWVKPVVDALIVPAHAAGSVVRVQGIYGNSGPLQTVDSGRGNVLERFAGAFMGSAHAAAAELPSCQLANPNNTCIAFDIASLPSTTVQVFADGNSNTATIYPNNFISNVTVGGLAFTNLRATTTNLLGTIGSPNCVSEEFSFPRRSSNVCDFD
jgi:hypothetical protein